MKRNMKDDPRRSKSGCNKNIHTGNNKRGGTRKPSPKTDEAIVEVDKPTNDVDWYFDNAEVYKTASRLSFQNFIGRPTIDKVYTPSVCAIYTNPSVGISVKYNTAGVSERSGLNLAAQKLYTKLSIFSGRGSTYAPQDVGIMIAAIAEVVAQFEYLRRAFGIVLFYNERNRDIPTKLLAAMGIEPDDFYANQANYRKRFNKLVQSIDQIPLIMNISYIKKAMFMYQNIYTDSQSLMAQMYMFVPSSTWILDEAISEQGSVLLTKPVCYDGNGNATFVSKTMSARLDDLSAMISALLNSSTLNTIYADIYNLANKTGEVKFFKMDILSDDYSIAPVYDPMILLQIHNADIVGEPMYPRNSEPSTRYLQQTPYNDVFCDATQNAIVYNPCALDKSGGVEYPVCARSHKLLDFNTGDPTDEQIVESTRLAAFAYPGAVNPELVDSQNRQLRLMFTLGDHYITYMIIWGNKTGIDAYDLFHVKSNNDWMYGYSNVPASVPIILQGTAFFADFPIGYGYDVASGEVLSVNADLDFNTLIDRQYLDGINDLVLLSMFNLR